VRRLAETKRAIVVLQSEVFEAEAGLEALAARPGSDVEASTASLSSGSAS
jgi:hypothetical protein